MPSQTSNPVSNQSSIQLSSPPFDGLLALRALACWIVVIGHAGMPRKSIVAGGLDWSWIFTGHGFLAVWIFFVLSGYLMGKAFIANRYKLNWAGVKQFWTNRLVRIVPLCYFAFFFQIIFVYPAVLRPENFKSLLKLLTFTYNALPLKQFNGVFWSLSTEMQFYFIVPLLILLLRPLLKSRSLCIMGIIAIASAIGGIRFAVWQNLHNTVAAANFEVAYLKYVYTPLWSNLDLFIGGILLNGLVVQPDTKVLKILQRLSKYRYWIASVMAVSYFLVGNHHLYFQELWTLPDRPFVGFRTLMSLCLWHPLTILIVGLYILVFDGGNLYDQKPQALTLERLKQQPIRILEFLGMLSFGVYVWHLPILTTIRERVIIAPIPLHHSAKVFFLGGFLSLIAAAITYYTVEVPGQGWKRGIKQTR
jgi:peptidoglycan/LPS O-acetylase OafA/YrhL